jgi:hypothetical protein
MGWDSGGLMKQAGLKFEIYLYTNFRHPFYANKRRKLLTFGPNSRRIKTVGK